MPYVQKLYNYFQFIAYETPTYRVYPAAPEVGNSRLAPVPRADDLTNDATYRLRRFARVLEDAQMQVMLHFGNQTDTLKIFVAPEFYFRPNSGQNNSYTMDAATSLMKALRGMFTSTIWEHWLIVPGSVFWLEAHPRVGPVYWNTSLLIKGGPEGPTEFVDKTSISPIDGAPRDEGPDTNPYFTDYFNYSTRLRSIMRVDNKAFGIEICRDHYLKYLKETTRLYKENHGVSPLINIHLLTACGMNPEAHSMAAKVNGYFLRVDGVPNPISPDWPYPRSQMMRITANNFDSITANATTVDLTAAPNSQTIAVPTALKVNSPDNAGYPQQVKIYDRQAF